MLQPLSLFLVSRRPQTFWHRQKSHSTHGNKSVWFWVLLHPQLKPKTCAFASASLELKKQVSIQTQRSGTTKGAWTKLTTSLTPVTQAADSAHNISYHKTAHMNNVHAQKSLNQHSNTGGYRQHSQSPQQRNTFWKHNKIFWIISWVRDE